MAFCEDSTTCLLQVSLKTMWQFLFLWKEGCAVAGMAHQRLGSGGAEETQHAKGDLFCIRDLAACPSLHALQRYRKTPAGKKNNRFCVLRTSGRGTPAFPRTRHSRCQVWTLEIILTAPELAQMPAKRILSVSSYSNLLTWLHGKKDAPGPGRPTGAPQDASKNIGRGTLANPGDIRKIRGTCP